NARVLGGLTEPFLVLPDFLEFLPILIADLSRLLRQYPELFRVVPGRLGQVAVLFRDLAALLGVLAAVLRLLAPALGQQAPLLRLGLIRGHVASSSGGSPSETPRCLN